MMKAKLSYCAVHDCKHRGKVQRTKNTWIKKKNRIREPIGNGHDVDRTFHALLKNFNKNFMWTYHLNSRFKAEIGRCLQKRGEK